MIVDNVYRKKKLEWLCSLIDDSKVVWNASSGGHVEVLRMLLEVEGVNVNVARRRGGGTFEAQLCGQLCRRGTSSYTAAVEENTKCSILFFTISFKILMVPVMFIVAYFSGSSMDFPAAFKAAK